MKCKVCNESMLPLLPESRVEILWGDFVRAVFHCPKCKAEYVTPKINLSEFIFQTYEEYQKGLV